MFCSLWRLKKGTTRRKSSLRWTGHHGILTKQRSHYTLTILELRTFETNEQQFTTYQNYYNVYVNESDHNVHVIGFWKKQTHSKIVETEKKHQESKGCYSGRISLSFDLQIIREPPSAFGGPQRGCPGNELQREARHRVLRVFIETCPVWRQRQDSRRAESKRCHGKTAGR